MISRMNSGAQASSGTEELTDPRARFLPRVGRALLLLFALVLPFESPLFRLAMLQITTVELVLYALLAVAFASALVGVRTTPLRALLATLFADPLARAATLFAAVLFVSAAAAPSHRAAAVKFALRSLSGIFVFFATKLLARADDVRRVLISLVAGALISAITALVDRFAPSSAVVWKYFHEASFSSLGLLRASGVFAYPTIGAMYWEAAVPLLVVLPFAKPDETGRERNAARTVSGVALGSALLVAAILASATRSGLAGTAVGCLALLALARRSPLGVRRAAAVGLAVTLALGVGSIAFGSLLGQRLLWWRDGQWLRVEYHVGATPASVRAREPFLVPVHLQNTGVLTWRRGGSGAVDLSYHWERLSGGSATLSDFEGLRTPLPADVPPQGEIDVLARARGPTAPGTYRLSWDLVQEDVCWFSERGNPTAGHPIVVEEYTDAAPSGASFADRPGPVTPVSPPSRAALWRAALVLWRGRPLLGVGPDNFRRRYEAVLAATPGNPPYDDTRIHANNLYLETLADLGLAGIAALAWIGLELLRWLLRHGRRGCAAGMGSAVAAGTFFVHGALDYFFEFTPLLGLFWLLLGLTSVSESALHGAPPSSRR
jgi:hypothetical protein